MVIVLPLKNDSWACTAGEFGEKKISATAASATTIG
jgi:hypothetical protein